ncbi:type 1 glutamine amidotransferase domain-containing protein [Aeribacillus sp. FSL W8-0870]|jgi:putative intracellular protease/amidase|uniref:type 1 glutamine amidotransferase domain-containing protein n=1 Tax=Aeribacillus sp. FSL W8-0870 TaxID=2954706 RepID=UPI0030CEA903
MAQKRVLMVVTSHAQITEGHPTGLWLSEFAEPYEIFKERGFAITVASIKGGYVPIDPRSLNEESKAKWPDAIRELEATPPLSEISAEGFDALFLPGGHGTMFDFPDDAVLQTRVREFVESDRVVAAVCHGPAGLVHVKLSSGEYLVKGKKVTSFTNEEERAVQLDPYMPFLLEDRLRENGAIFVAAPMWSNHVEVDGKLVTGQNPQSGEATAKKVSELLEAGS